MAMAANGNAFHKSRFLSRMARDGNHLFIYVIET